MGASEQSPLRTSKFKSGVPHQRAVAKDPKIAHIVLSNVRADAEIPSRIGQFNAARIRKPCLKAASSLRNKERARIVSKTETKPPKPSRRGYILLITAIVVVVAGWSAAWAYGRSILGDQIDQQLQRMATQGLDLSCGNLEIAGYPFRYEVACRDMQSEDRFGATGALGGLNAVALIYNPRHVIFEATSPAAMSVPVAGLSGDVTWTTARASMKFSGDALGALDAVVDQPAAVFGSTLSEGAFAADKAEVHLRQVPDVAGMLEGFVTVDRLALKSLPALPQSLMLRGHARIEGGMALMVGADLASLVQAKGGELPIRLMLAEAGFEASRAAASGDLVLAGDGTLSGVLEVTIGNAADLLQSLKPVFPPEDQAFSLLEGVVKSLDTAATEVDGVRTIKVPVTINQGLVQVGLLPVGRIPPLFQAGS
ncbi:hypothetical protein CHH27_19155 [Labrenzia sp. VG12]|nr:hypothetical protein CHH27_19155 [Labrenzia sp. VG12]